MNELLNAMSEIVKNNTLITPIIVFIAGILTSFSPCSLSTIPLILTYINGGKITDTKQSFKLSVVFSLGMAITFTILGVLATILGRIMSGVGSWWYIVLGILLMLMVLQILEIFTFIKPTYLTSKNTKKGYIGAFLTGILGGLFSSPCSTPVLIVVLSIISANGNMLWGILLLLLYALGNTILVILTGTFLGLSNKIIHNKNYGKVSSILKYILAFIVFIMALYMFYTGF